MSSYTISFQVTGGITVEAESEEAALAYFDSEGGQEAVGMCLSSAHPTITEASETE